ncbi:MAG: acetate kinase [Alkalinema sp. RU_4_3]|nr:acetate kinase [Alkalinema sp. RU_4_3]
MKILVLNAGSSSQKSCLYEITEDSKEPSQPLWSADINMPPQMTRSDRRSSLEQMLQTLWAGDRPVIADRSAIDAVGHRVVHGGQYYDQTTRIDAQVKSTIASLTPLAPAHNPANLEGIELVETLLGKQVPQFAVFDTAFHRQMPDAATIYPGPYDWIKTGIRRYGFHGISHEYCSDRAAQLLGRDLKELRLINCHLGNGCSLAAIESGISIDTTMGFTPLEGLMMGTRSGSIDPGILIYLMRERGYDGITLDRLLNQESGLKGLSGVSHDLREIQRAIEADNQRAKLAWDVYIHRIRSGIGAMLIGLGGLDALIFTAGVGEHQPAVRSAVCAGLGFLGVVIDETLNRSGRGDRDIATADSPVRILVIQTQEDWQIAKNCWDSLH